MSRPVNLPAVRRSLARLDRLAVEHPELLDLTPGAAGDGVAGWERTLMEAGMGEVETKQVAFRLPLDLIARLDRYADATTAELGGLAVVTRSDVVRVLLARALDVLEAEDQTDDEGGAA